MQTDKPRRSSPKRGSLAGRSSIANTPLADAPSPGNEPERLYELFMQTPAMIAVSRGPKLVYEFANPMWLQVVGKTSDVIGKPLLEVFPELRGQPIYDILMKVYKHGEPYIGNEVLVKLDTNNDGKPQDVYFNFIYKITFCDKMVFNFLCGH